MFSPAEFRELVSGRRRGAGAAALRGLLRALEVPYTAAVNWRNGRYDSGRAAMERVGVPVISVGNLTLGGTGKTPFVKWLARWFIARGKRVAIVSRGYGSRDGQPNDEALELAAALSGATAGLPGSKRATAGLPGGVPQVQNPDRVAAAHESIREHHCDVILLDDGFQHRRLHRDLDIVLLDALEPFGHDHVFPRGTLREPVSGLVRADFVCLSRADVLSESERGAIRARVQEFAPHSAWCELAHAPTALMSLAGETQPIETLRDKRVFAFCGIGNPAGFRHTVTASGAELVEFREFPDHYAYTPADLAELTKSAADAQADLLVCTQKDFVKLVSQTSTLHPQLSTLCAICIEIEFLAGQDLLDGALDRVFLC